MRKYIFIKDESYSSTLFNNAAEYLNKDDNFTVPLLGQTPYKIKMMPVDEARNLIGKHPMLLNAETKLDNVMFNEDTDKIAMVSFGGTVVRPALGTLMRMADENQVGLMVSEASSNKESELLYNAYYSTADAVQEKGTPHYCYMMMTKIADTDIYYLVLNPNLVHVTSHIEIEDDVWIEQIKGVKDTIKDNIFSMKITPEVAAGHIISGGLCGIDLIGSSVIQPEDKEDFLSQLRFKMTYRKDGCSHILNEGHIFVTHSKDTHLIIEVENELLGDFINKDERLRWEYILTSLRD